jgi:predicted dehydrogenase
MWNPELAGGGMYDLGVYNVALVNHYFGANPLKIHVHSKISDSGIDESVAAQLDYPEGKVAQIYSGLNSLTLWEATLYGTKGWIRIEDFFRTQQVTSCIKGQTEVHPIPFTSTGFYHEIMDTVERIKNGYLESDLFTHQDSLDSARIVDEILRLCKL